MNRLKELLAQYTQAQAQGNDQEVARIFAEMQKLSEASPLGNNAVICNLTDREVYLYRTYGTYRIRGKKPRESYALTIVHPRMDAMDFGEKRQIQVPIAATDIAADLVRDFNDDAGEGSFLGLFVCAGDRPTNAELELYTKKLEESDMRFIATADKDYEENNGKLVITTIHRAALQRQGLEREWAHNLKPMPDCPACKTKIQLGAIKCPTCGAILDRKKWEQFAERFPAPVTAAAEPAKPAARS